MKYLRQIFLLVITLVLSQHVIAGSGSNTGNNVLGNIQKKKEITVGVTLLAPWVMKNKEGKLIGFEIDIANQLAKDLGVKVTFKQHRWNELIPALEKGEIDIIASGLSITPQRALKIDFSTPYSSSGYSLVSNLDLTKDFSSIKDLNNDKIFIAAVKGTVSASLAAKVFPLAKLDLRETAKDATSAVVNGTVHAFISSSPVPEFISLKNPDKVDLPLKKPLLTTKEAFAVKRGNQEMLNFLNAWVVAHLADEWIESSHKYWFKSLKWQRQVNNKL
jgi:polar amino acid transport system substrate-binding protein